MFEYFLEGIRDISHVLAWTEQGALLDPERLLADQVAVGAIGFAIVQVSGGL